MCRGVDSRDLRPDQPRQSVSCDVNYGIRLTDQSQVENLFTNVCKEVSRKLNNAKLVGRQVSDSRFKDPGANTVLIYTSQDIGQMSKLLSVLLVRI